MKEIDLSKEIDMLKEFSEFIGDNEISTAEDFDETFNEFVMFKGLMPELNKTEDDAENVYDYLELAQYATSKKKALQYAKKALELEPNNLDAEVMVAELSTSSVEKLLDKYESLLEKEAKKLEQESYFEDIGDFWVIFETRPYMRLYYSYVQSLIDCGRIKSAVKHSSEMLRLCKNDNLGIRYRLMNLYTYLEDEESAIELFNRYEQEDSAMFLIPLSILYYKQGDLKKSAKYLKELKNTNKDTLEFFKGLSSGDMEFMEKGNLYGYAPYTIGELIEEFNENLLLFLSSKTYFDWAFKKLKSMK